MPNENNQNFFGKRKRNNDIIDKINNIIGQGDLSLYGTDRNSDVEGLNSKFHEIINNEINSINNNSDDPTTFISKLWSDEKKNNAYNNLMNSQFMNISGNDVSYMSSFIQEAYKNKLIEQSDLDEVSSQLIELSEAILITRDAIVTSNVVEGRLSRTLDFDNIDKSVIEETIPIVEYMEKKFKLQEKIKNFITVNTLKFGEYYVYITPYSKIFNDFMKSKENTINSNLYSESTLLEFVSEPNKGNNQKNKKNAFISKLYKEYTESTKNSDKNFNQISESEFTSDISNILDRIVVCNDSVPIPILDEGINSIKEFQEKFMNFQGNHVVTENDKKENMNLFQKVATSAQSPEGVVFNNKNKSSDDFSDIVSDCYIKLINPMQIIPIKIMDKIIGYYYIQETEEAPLSGVISSTLYYNRVEDTHKDHTIVSSIAEQIVKSFNKDFLKENIKFKELIVEAINYYNLNEKKIKFQFIPAEYMVEFKIDEDENGNGTSMIKKSLFYAKLYLMLLLFKIMSIILYSNDTKINYIKSSGIDKNVINKVQEIARMKQSRQINMYDLFNYTTLINKIGNGNEMFVPVGRSNERAIETEILSGQDIQLNSDLLEMLKNSYILATGVPAAILNYLNEADFAKVIEQNNTKFNGRVINYQMDLNVGITEMYKKIMKWSTNINPNLIDNFTFSFQPPRNTSGVIKSEMISTYNSLLDFYIQLYMGDNANQDPENEILIREFKKGLAKDLMPMLNFDKIEEIFKEALILSKKEKLKPNPNNGDNGDDIGLSDLEKDMEQL